MVFQSNDESDLVYPNLTNCQITASNALVLAANNSLPPPPPPFSTSRAEALLGKPALERYDFKVEREILARNKSRGGKSSISNNSGDIEHASVEVTLSDLKDALE
ncbi:hypothetical protein HJC23_012492 [Cyclotella cryptica]|uniref:Uncharacterized protein n=1 Tax=Cyclotella cryptica TaxID=29204 RepID=A0ABD3PAZ3_9STRA|eukprot:CCRYP_016305-RA/>CCRYP_016305-RA protein AED:0.42 eAED:0.41 QI:0/-1/0/1/-1/1/1/0/104